MIRSAVIDETGVYRYLLERTWAPLIPRRCCFIMLNPSTADAEKDDPTIRRCVGFAKSWGFGSIAVLNLFAFRTYDPRLLRSAENPIDPIGPENDTYLRDYTSSSGLIIAAWGAFPVAAARAKDVVRLVDRTMFCLGTTAQGHPRHPLYVPAKTERTVFHLPGGRMRKGER